MELYSNFFVIQETRCTSIQICFDYLSMIYIYLEVLDGDAMIILVGIPARN